MKTIRFKKWMLAATFILCFQLTKAQTPTPVDNFIVQYMKDNKIPGLSVAIIKDGRLAWTKGYGYADIDKDIPFTPNTINHSIASISKNITATALFKLWEEGLFQLDDPINDYLPFHITNPFYPNTPISFRMLLNHTSSIYSNEQEPVNFQSGPPGTAMPLGEYLQKRLVPGGIYYNVVSPSFHNFLPGTVYAYSNAAYAVIGYLVERISGMPFNEYCNQYIFQPLCMNTTGWYFSEIDINTVSRPYADNGIRELNLYENTLYPSCQIKTSNVDLSKYLLMHMNYGILDGTRIIDSTTEVMMRHIETIYADDPGSQKFAYCLGYNYVYDYFTAEEYFGHSGGDQGVAGDMFQNINDNTGFIVLQNKNYPLTVNLLLFLVFQVTDTLSTSQPLLDCSYTFNPCQQTMEYWQNNPAHWAINAVPMKIGKHYYSKPEILNLLNLPINNDASRVLTKALITAKFNIAQGSELAPIVITYNEAMDLLGSPPLPYSNPVSLNSATGIQMLALATTLNSYNSGNLNTTACSGDQAPMALIASGNEADKAAVSFSLSAFPNPSSGNVTISFSLHQIEKVSIKVFDISGRLVKAWADKVFEKGEHRINWNGDTMNAGTYIVKMEAVNFSETKKLIVTK